jgi:hypothetical protein
MRSSRHGIRNLALFGAATKAFEVPLWSDLLILVDPTTPKEAVMHHA